MKTTSLSSLLLLTCLSALGAVEPPPGAIGFPNREPGLDALPGFKSPPAGYGEVAFYWWVGDPLTPERLSWQLDQLAGHHVMGLQVNYAHSDRGGRSYGLTYPSEPPLFSEAWWKLYGWFLGQAKQRGMAASLSDYTLGVGQGWFMDEVLNENPDLRGATLAHATQTAPGGREFSWEVPENTVSVMAYRLTNGAVLAESALDLRARLGGRRLRWLPPAGDWRVCAVHYAVNPFSVDPMDPRTGPKIIAKFFQRFEDHNPGEGGQGLNFFFSDELEFGVHGNLWNSQLAGEFQRRKGYDLLPELPALFLDLGPRTPKVRLDYRDVMVALSEEGYFRPVFEWHQRRGMIYGCDHGGRGRNVTEFGDYFRTQRWMSGPGCDQPGLSGDLIKNKVASSIAHLYERPRVWLEGYHSSGWGTTPAQLADATFRNFLMGQNLLTLHGLYYSTHGGWWEWAPPCNHFRMPYWKHLGGFMECVQRLSYLLSQGRHRCDTAIVYPVAPSEAGMGGGEAVNAAFGLGQRLYEQGQDFDFMDFESLARARIEGRELCVAGERYRVLVLPALRALRFSTLEKAREFHRAGGLVVAFQGLPEASDRAGRDDAVLDEMVRELFGAHAHEPIARQSGRQRNPSGGLGLRTSDPAEVVQCIAGAFPADLKVAGASKPFCFMHRQVGPRDLYALYAVPSQAECTFRATGRVELWNPWTGATRPLPILAQTATETRLRLPLEPTEVQLIVFSPTEQAPPVGEVAPAVGVRPSAVLPALDGDWEFELVPTLDNRWGDYRWPPSPGFIAAEARRMRYADEVTPNPGWQAANLDDAKWRQVTTSFGPRFWKLGPLPEGVDTASLETKLAGLTEVDPATLVSVAGKTLRWESYDFSWRWGVEGDPGHQGYHGLKEQVQDEFIGLGQLRTSGTGTSREAEPGGRRYYLWTAVASPQGQAARATAGGLQPAAAWLNGTRLPKPAGSLSLRAGSNPLLLRYDRPGKGWFVCTTNGAPTAETEDTPFSSAAAYIWDPADAEAAKVSFRRSFELPARPAQARLRITCDNGYTLYLNGQEVGRGSRWETIQEYDLVPKLRIGRNVLAVAARNDGGSAGLIAELTLGQTRLATDASWRCARTEPDGWREVGFDDSRWVPAARISSFEGSLWATHQFGPPRLEPPPAPTPSAASGSLAMRWYQDTTLLPFDTRPQSARPAGWYRFMSPPGLRALTLVARGQVLAWADGRALKVEPLRQRPDGSWEFRATDPTATQNAEPGYVAGSPNPVLIALRVEQERGSYGGAALPEPVAFECGPGRVALGDWSKNDGLSSYSGGAWYRKTVTLTPEQARGPLTLSLGTVAATAEVRVNGQVAGLRVAPPWRVELGALVKPGENRLEILVYNTLANHYQTIPTRYRGSPLSGLLGPVVLESVSQ